MPNNNDGNKPALQITITCTPNGKMSISGFPTNFFAAITVLSEVHKTILNYFQQLLKSGKLDENLTIIPSKIMTKENSLVSPNGKPLTNLQ